MSNPTISSLLNTTVPNMKTGRNINELSVIPEENTLETLRPMVSVMGGKEKKKKRKKQEKEKKKRKRTRRKKKINFI